MPMPPAPHFTMPMPTGTTYKACRGRSEISRSVPAIMTGLTAAAAESPRRDQAAAAPSCVYLPGEIKLLQHLRQLGAAAERESALLVGPDADLLLLALAARPDHDAAPVDVLTTDAEGRRAHAETVTITTAPIAMPVTSTQCNAYTDECSSMLTPPLSLTVFENEHEHTGFDHPTEPGTSISPDALYLL